MFFIMRELWSNANTHDAGQVSHTASHLFFQADLDPDTDLLFDLCEPGHRQDKAELGETEQYHYQLWKHPITAQNNHLLLNSEAQPFH